MEMSKRYPQFPTNCLGSKGLRKSQKKPYQERNSEYHSGVFKAIQLTLNPGFLSSCFLASQEILGSPVILTPGGLYNLILQTSGTPNRALFKASLLHNLY